MVLGEFLRSLKKTRVSTERYCDMVNILVVHSQSDSEDPQGMGHSGGVCGGCGGQGAHMLASWPV